MKLIFTEAAAKTLVKLPPAIARRIVRKMQWFAAQEDPLSFAKPLKNANFGSHRFRVGEYRVLVDIQHKSISILFVLAVRHRKDAYGL